MEKMHELKKRFEKELEQYMHMGDKITMGELETIHKITDTIKNIDKIMIDKIMMLEDEEGGYSQAGEMRGGMNRGGNMMPGGGYSYRRQRRDSRGRYSREGSYSYDDGMEELHELLDEMMETADERTKSAIKRFKAELHG